MMVVHAVYKVNWYPPGPGTQSLVSMRVSAPSLEDFLRVLIFNGVAAFDCKTEKDS